MWPQWKLPVAAIMVLLLMSVTVLHLFTLAMLFIATMEKTSGLITDLWSNCIHDNITGNWLCAASNGNDWLQAVQSLMVLSVVFSSISFLVFLGQLFTMSKGGLFYFTGLCQVFAGFTSFATCLIYTFHRKKILEDSRDLSIGHFGFCFILAWSCVPLLLFSGVLYVHLRKRQ
ncbi:hypothetical protein J4Q44_G00101150 [Coregonus suidteri]|uniref:Epithelial membrane protein 3 n=1 Tax=Coregonus suidteri TaxID=861788 RepID=A0AAN8QWW4_9TELE